MTFLFQGKNTREIAYVAAIVVLRVSIEYFFVPSVAGNADTAALAYDGCEIATDDEKIIRIAGFA